MGMDGVLCALSAKRHAMLQADPGLLFELTDPTHAGGEQMRGLLHLGKAWDALDLLVSRRGEDALLGDAVLARSGKSMRAEGGFGKTVHGNYGQETCADDEIAFIREQVAETQRREIEELEGKLTKLIALYAAAAKAGDGMMAVVV